MPSPEGTLEASESRTAELTHLVPADERISVMYVAPGIEFSEISIPKPTPCPAFSMIAPKISNDNALVI
jgi:hypothetical protein